MIITKTLKPTSDAKKKPKKLSLLDLSLRAEPLKAACSERPLCQKCGLYLRAGSPFSTPWMPEESTGLKLLLVGPPPVEDSNYVRPLKPAVGKLVRKMAVKCGFKESEIAFVSAVRCAAENPSMNQIRSCRPFLLQVIKKLNPKNILGLGKYALKALTNTNNQNITKARGKALEVPDVSKA